MRIAVVYSELHDDSERVYQRLPSYSLNDVVEALTVIGHQVSVVQQEELVREPRGASSDLYFNLAYGFGDLASLCAIPELLDRLGCAYTGPNAHGHGTALKKLRAKELFAVHNIPTPPYRFLRFGAPIPAELDYPVVCKPIDGAYSVGVSFCEDRLALVRCVEGARAGGTGGVFVEEFLDGREFQIGVVGTPPRALGLAEFSTASPGPPICTHADKMGLSGRLVVQSNPQISEMLREDLTTLAVNAFIAAGQRDYARVDARLRGDSVNILEINSMPLLARAGFFGDIAAAAGRDFVDVVHEIVESSAVRLM